MEQLSGLDAAFVHQESRRTPMHVTAALIYDVNSGALDLATVTSLCRSRLSGFELIRRRLHRLPMGVDTPYWVDAGSPNWDAHIREADLAGQSSWADFQAHLAQWHASPLDLKRPLWSLQLLHGVDDMPGLPARCQVLLLKVHHAVIDGMSLARLIDALHRAEDVEASPGADARPGELDDWAIWSNVNRNFLTRQVKLLKTVRKVVPGLLRARDARSEFADLAPIHRGAAHFNNRVRAGRTTGALLLPIETVTAIRRGVRRVTTNDIAIAIVGGALRRYLRCERELADATLSCGAPINLRERDDASGGNKIATMVVGMGTHIDDPVERVREVHRYAVAGKKTIGALGTGTVMDISDSLPPSILAEGIRTMAWASRYADVPVPFHTMVSNVPGPSAELHLAGARLVVPLGLGPIRDNMGLFHIVSNGDSLLSLSFSACRRLVPEAADYERCLAAAADELIAAI